MAGEKIPVLANRDGAYLTIWSTGGVIFGVINMIGSFGAGISFRWGDI